MAEGTVPRLRGGSRAGNGDPARLPIEAGDFVAGAALAVGVWVAWYVGSHQLQSMPLTGTALLAVAAVMVGSRLRLQHRRRQFAVAAAEQAETLARSERRFRALLSHSDEIIVLTDAAGIVLDVSDSVTHVFGVDGSERVGRDLRDIVHPDDVSALEADLERTSQIGHAGPSPRRCRDALGVWRDIEMTMTNLLHMPDVRAIVLNVHDVTAQRETGIALRHAEDHLLALVHYSSDLLAIIDDRARLLRPTPNAALGYPAGSLVGQNSFDLVHPDDLAAANDALAAAISRPCEPVSVALRVRHSDGTWRWFDVVMTNRLDDEAVRGVIVNGHDVTDRCQVERALHESDQFSRTVIESLNGMVIALDAEGMVVRANAGWYEFVADCGGDPTIGAIGTDFQALCDLGRESGYEGSVELAAGIRSVLAGRTRLFRVEYRAPTADERWLVLRAAPLTTDTGGCVIHQVDVTERKHYEQQLTEAALRDALTGLPNRALLTDRLNTALERSQDRPEGVGVLFLDIDHFKVLNDGRGHAAGDRLLVALAARLRAVVGPGDTVARFGGDEFVVLCETPDGARQLQTLAEQIVAELAAPFTLDDGEEVSATVSIGIALSDPTATADTLLRDADAAMYQAKDKGRNRFGFFDRALRARVLSRLQTETELRHALERGELRVWYQPIVRVIDGGIIGAEALLRWQHPDRGFVYPDEFISVSEETGLINPIGAWVLREACTQAKRWQRQREEPFGIAVNVSARQLARPAIVDEVAAALSVSGLDSEHLALELTETSLIDPRHAPSSILHALRRLGVRLSLDDFGTGFSSLSYLKRFPIQAIKIDRSFVEGLGRDPDDAAIVTATIAIAQTLALHLVAEGIETEAQRQELLRLGCIYGQGYLFSRPVPPDQFSELLATGALVGYG